MLQKITICLLCFYVFALSHSYGQGYTDVSSTSGINFQHTGVDFSIDHSFGTGAAWFDYNNDGFLDIYITNRNVANKLFKNNGDGTFTDVAVSLGVDDSSFDGAGVAIGDINNDGFQDIYLANGDEDKIYLNNFGGSFTDITIGSGIEVSGDSRGTSASFGDYDEDGFLDIYVANHDIIPGSTNASLQDRLFLNNGNNTFTDVSGLLGVSELSEAGFIGGWTDYDKDGDLDIILVNDCGYSTIPPGGTRIFRNDGGTDPINDWTFTEVSTFIIGNDCSHGMGIGIGDYNRDGWMDIFYTDIGVPNLFKNNGGTFSHVTNSSGMGNQGGGDYSWGTSFLDYDNDMDQDIVMAVGAFFPTSPDQYSNFYNNGGSNFFFNVAASLGVDVGAKTRTIVHGDYDNDGDLDLLMVNYDSLVTLYRNDVINNNNYLRIFLDGDAGNKDGIGAKVKVTTPDGKVQYFEMRSGSNLGGGDEICAHFGVGINSFVLEVEVTWLSGSTTTVYDITINQVLTISESNSMPLPVELIEFTGEAKERVNHLNWSTASETNNAFFEIQRSEDGATFNQIGIVQGNGNSNIINHYSFIDAMPLTGRNYYRLKQIDEDGNYAYSKIIVITFSQFSNLINIYPNPTNGDKFFAEFSFNTNAPISLELFDLNGKLILQNYSIQMNGQSSSTFEFSIGNMPKGIYYCRITHPTLTVTQKLVVN